MERLVGDGMNISLFDGPDRGGADTLHGEVDDHWWKDDPTWDDYEAIDIYTDPDDTWADVDVPKWEQNTITFPIEPVNPLLPELTDTLEFTNEEDIYVVEGRFLTGAVLWPHEEWVEQFVDGTLQTLGPDEMVPVYWLCSYYLFIPAEYGDPQADTTGKALVVYGKGGTPKGSLPPWLHSQLNSNLDPEDEDSWLYNAGVLSCRRLRVPVMVIWEMPERTNTWFESDTSHPQGGITGYDSEARVSFPEQWAAVEPADDLIAMHPQYMYAASFIRAGTFLDGFFDPVEKGTEAWSQWDDITNGNGPYTPIDNVIIEGGSKRGYATWIAGVADERIKAIVSNGMANLHIEQQNRLGIDEKWETTKQTVPTGWEYRGHFDPPNDRDLNQIIPTSGMLGHNRFFGALYRGEADKFRHYSVFDIFRNQDVMQDGSMAHEENPQPEIRVYNLQGAQDAFWARNAWVNWVEDKVFHGRYQYFEFDPFAVHPPYYAEFTRSMQSFCESVWFGRPMPEITITDIDYDMPYQGVQYPAEFPILGVKARFQISTAGGWDLKDYGSAFDPDDPQNFKMRLCVGLRPVSADFSRGMWSDYESLQNTNRSTPWWEMAPIDVTPITVGLNVVAYDAEFLFQSSDYENEDLPPGFESLSDLDIVEVPPGCHVAFVLRTAVQHEDSQHGGEAYPIRASSIIEYLPPYGVGPDPEQIPDVE